MRQRFYREEFYILIATKSFCGAGPGHLWKSPFSRISPSLGPAGGSFSTYWEKNPLSYRKYYHLEPSVFTADWCHENIKEIMNNKSVNAGNNFKRRPKPAAWFPEMTTTIPNQVESKMPKSRWKPTAAQKTANESSSKANQGWRVSRRTCNIEMNSHWIKAK